MVFSLFFSLFDLFRKVAKNDNAEKEEGIQEIRAVCEQQQEKQLIICQRRDMGKVILITGASRGIGLAIGENCYRRGR